MLKVSIIIPVYNTKHYLPQCVESILSQSFTDFELLLIDDGSTDGSGAVCASFAEKDTRVRVFHKENGGVSSARNLGLDHAQGEWAVFVDSDDLLADNALEYLMNDAVDDVDMVYGGIRKFDEKNNELETIPVKQKERLTVEQALDAFIVPKQCNGDWHRYLFNRVFRRSIIDEFGLRFNPELFYKEDGLFVVQYLCRCKNSAVCVPEIVYLYRQTANSAMGSLSTSYKPKLLTNVDAHGLIYKELKNRGVDKVLKNRELAHLFQNYDWISGIMKQSGAFSIKNKWMLLGKIIKNGGFFNYLYHRVILRYGRKIKRRL